MTSDSVLISFGERVKTLRRETNISQEALADKAQMHRTYLSGIERGERNVSLVNIAKLAEALDVPVSELVKGIE